MSALVFAGSAQFIAIGLIAQGASPLVILMTTLIVNLRHVLYSSSVAPYLAQVAPRIRILVAFLLTDEAYAIGMARYRDDPPGSTFFHWYTIGAGVGIYITWAGATLVGVMAGRLVPDLLSWGLDFALPATFIALLIPLMRTRSDGVAALTAGLGSLVGLGLPHRLGIVVAVVVGVTAGIIADTWIRRKA